MAGASGSTCRAGPHHWHLAGETCRLSWALKIYSTSPGLEGLRTGPVLGLSAGGGWRHVSQTANSQATQMKQTNERTLVSEYAITQWFNFQLYLFSVLTLPCDTI